MDTERKLDLSITSARLDIYLLLQQQVKSLLAAHRKVDPNTPLFWKEVAKLVKGKNAAQCRKKFEDRFKTPSSKSKKTKKATKELSPINLGANKKTAKFKQKVRQFVQRVSTTRLFKHKCTGLTNLVRPPKPMTVTGTRSNQRRSRTVTVTSTASI